MKIRSLLATVIKVLSVLPLVLASAGSYADEQVLSQGIASGQTALDSSGASGAVEPNFIREAEDPAYSFFIDPDVAADFRVVEFGEGSINVLDGNFLRKYDATGAQIFDNAFPVLCTNILVPQPKKNDPLATQSLGSCTRTLALPDGTFRVFGADKGKKLVVYKYKSETANCTPGWVPADGIENRFCDGELVVAGSPPQVAEAIADSNENTESRTGVAEAYWLIADKSKVYLGIPGDGPGVPDSLELILRVSGKNLTGAAPFGLGRVIIADDDGVLYEMTKDGTGTWSLAVWTAAAFGPLEFPDGNKTVQNIKMKSDANEDLLYISDRASRKIYILDAQGDLLENPPFQNPLVLDAVADFFPNDIDVIGAIIGTWDECTTSNEGLCQIGQRVNEAFVEDVVPRTADGSANTFIGKKFVLQDCRWVEGTLPDGVDCPVTPDGCEIGDDLTGCDLDVIALALIADPTFADLLPTPPPESVLPWYLRADLDYPPDDLMPPVDDVDLVDNQGTFFYYHIDTNSAFENLATTTYDIDIIRDNLVPDPLPDGGDEVCPNPLEELSAADLNEQTNMVAYLPDRYKTVRCRIDDPLAPCEFDRSAIIMVSSCNNPRRSPTWDFSGHLVGVEAAFEEVDTFRQIGSLQNAELQAFKDNVLCADPYYLPDPEDTGGTNVGPILTPSDCITLQSKLDQIAAKWPTCAAASNPSQGSSAENCNALNTQIANLEAIIATLAWPELLDPTDPEQFLLADFNPRGQFTGRLRAFTYSINNWWLTSNAAPLVTIGTVSVVDDDAIVTATADDLEDGDLTASIVWTVDGLPLDPPATGGTLSLIGLDPGDYTITASVTDGDGLEDSASVTVTIIPAP